ncbi:hypothetical protein CHS0354_022763 [Potamilus streckersoni]|uniref:Small ribosomal subunit protein mS35 mitochondrial conserved domain-containing protein n=1 Tax=Potamilus streckersoni TaxID=2493646 RepID=A0AAE0RT80_9BIVA|nr:hypothetical protein CHS0354_022763 [Potamilus streckersoni]
MSATSVRSWLSCRLKVFGDSHFGCVYSRPFLTSTNLQNVQENTDRRYVKYDDNIVETETEKFRVFEIPGLKRVQRERRTQQKKREYEAQPRFKQMLPDQDWTKVWPGPATFKWSVVPFPVRQGFIPKPTIAGGVPPGKYANTELIKIPNFLHLTPGHVQQHCQAIKKFCTPWPAGLESDQKCHKHFPLEVVTQDYCFSGSSIRDARARSATVQFKLSDLDLDYHARDKFIRLVGPRYNKNTDEVTLTADRCPLKKQNYDFIIYLLTALYHESWTVELWEKEKTLDDMEKYFWDLNASRKNILELLKHIHTIEKDLKLSPNVKALPYLPENLSEENLLALKEVKSYKEAVTDLFNEDETKENLKKYKEAVRTLLNIQTKMMSPS